MKIMIIYAERMWRYRRGYQSTYSNKELYGILKCVNVHEDVVSYNIGRCTKVYEGAWKYMKVYEGFWRYKKGYEGI